VLGITGTPVIDPTTQTLYVVTNVKEQPTGAGGPHYITQFHALNLINGQETHGSPVTVGDTTLHPRRQLHQRHPGLRPRHRRRVGRRGGRVNALRELQRPRPGARHESAGTPRRRRLRGLGSNSDFDNYHGWLVGYDAKTLKLVTLFNTDPNGGFGAVWQAGAAPSVASNGDLIFSTGNGTFDAFTTTTPPGPAAQGEPGFGLGYAGIGQSVGVTFGAAIPSTGVSSTGLFHDGVFPTDKPLAPDVFQPLSGTGIDFTAGPRTPMARNLPGDPLVSRHHAHRDDHRPDHRRHLQPRYSNVDLPTSVGGGTAFVGFGGSTDGRVATNAITSWTYSSGGMTLIDHSGGFASHDDVTATGITTFNGSEADLTDAGGQESGNLFANSRVNIRDFTTTFTFQMQPDTIDSPHFR